MALHLFSFPTAITFGAGARKEVAAHLAAAGIKRPLIVTDKGLAALPLTAEFQNDLRARGFEEALFAGVWGNPTSSQVRAGVTACKNHAADSVIGLGGGAALDVAKAVALMAV